MQWPSQDSNHSWLWPKRERWNLTIKTALFPSLKTATSGINTAAFFSRPPQALASAWACDWSSPDLMRATSLWLIMVMYWPPTTIMRTGFIHTTMTKYSEMWQCFQSFVPERLNSAEGQWVNMSSNIHRKPLWKPCKLLVEQALSMLQVTSFIWLFGLDNVGAVLILWKTRLSWLLYNHHTKVKCVMVPVWWRYCLSRPLQRSGWKTSRVGLVKGGSITVEKQW